MEAVVHQAFGDVINADASAVFVRADVDDAFVRDVAVGIAVKHVVRAFEAGGDVVGVQDGNLARFFQAVRPHHAQVHPRDDVHQRAAPRRGADRQSAAVFERHDAVAGQEGFQVFFDGDGADAGAAATMRDGEGFVQVQVGDVGAVVTGRGEADLRVEVGAVEVHLAAVAVDDGAEFADVALEDAVRRGVGDHDGGEAVGVFFGFEDEVGDVDVAVFVAGDDDDFHAGERRRCRVGAVRRLRDEADVALAVAAAFVVGADGKQTGVFALCAGVGLERDGVIAGGFCQHGFEFVKHFAVAFGLFERGEGVDVAELAPGDGHHFAGGVQFHGAGAERNHGAIKRQIPVGEFAQVAHHFGLAAVFLEYGVAEVLAAANGEGGQHRLRFFQRDFFVASGEDGDEQFDLGFAAQFVQRDADAAGVNAAQIVARVKRALHDEVGT